MKLKTGEALVLYDSLKNLGELFGDSIPIKLGFKIIRNMKQLELTYIAFDQARSNSINRYVDDALDEIPQDKVDEINKEIKEILDEEIEVNLIPLKLDELENASINLEILSGLYPIIENNQVQVI